MAAKKKARKKASKRKTTRKKASRKKTAKKRAAKRKTTRKKAAKKKTARKKTGKKKAAKKKAAKKGPVLKKAPRSQLTQSEHYDYEPLIDRKAFTLFGAHKIRCSDNLSSLGDLACLIAGELGQTKIPDFHRSV